MAAKVYGMAVVLVLAIAIAVVVHILLRRSLRTLLDDVVAIAPGTTFYSRLLAIGLVLPGRVFPALAGFLGNKATLPKGEVQ